MYARFVTQEIVGIASRDLKWRFFVAAEFTLWFVDRAKTPALAFGIAVVHEREILREDRRLFPAYTGTDLKNDLTRLLVGGALFGKNAFHALLEFFDRNLYGGKINTRK